MGWNHQLEYFLWFHRRSWQTGKGSWWSTTRCWVTIPRAGVGLKACLVHSCYAPMSFGKYDMELQVSVQRAEWLKRIVFRLAALAESQQKVELWISCIATVSGKPWINCIRHFSCKLERASKAIWPFFWLLKKEDKLVLGLQAAAGGKTCVKTRSVTVVVPRWKPRRQLRRKTCWPGTSWLKMPWWKRISTWKPPPLLLSWVEWPHSLRRKHGSLEGSSKISY